MKAWFDDIEIGSSIFFLVQTIERSIGGHGPPLGLTYTFNGGRQVPLKLDRVEDGQAYYKVFEKENGKGKREDMARKKKVTEVSQVTTTTTTTAVTATTTKEVSKEPPKYVTMDTAEELWELDFPEKPELFRQLVQQRIDLKYEVDAMEDRIKEINCSLLPFFERNGLPGVSLEGGYLVRRHEGSSATLDKVKLVESGVPVDVIEACTVRKKYVTVMVKGPKE